MLRCLLFFQCPFLLQAASNLEAHIFRPNFEVLQVCNRVTQLPVLFTLVLHSNWAITASKGYLETIFPCLAVA